MHFSRYFGFLFLLHTSFIAHKFYVSNTHVDYNKKSKTLQITTHLFTDDFEKAINRIYHTQAYLGTKKENPQAKDFLKEYAFDHFKIYIGDSLLNLNFIGAKHEASNLSKLYIESPPIILEKISQLRIKNTLLLEDFAEQQNIVTVSLEEKTTAYLTKTQTELIIKR